MLSGDVSILPSHEKYSATSGFAVTSRSLVGSSGGAAFAPISEMLMYQMRTLPGMPLTVHELIYSQIVLYNFVEDAWDHLMIFILASIEDLVSGIFKLLN